MAASSTKPTLEEEDVGEEEEEEESVVIHSGYLTRKRVGGRILKWEKLYAVLTPSALLFAKSPKELSKRTALQLKDVSRVEVLEGKKAAKKHSFQVYFSEEVGEGGRERGSDEACMLLAALTQGEATEWVGHLSKALADTKLSERRRSRGSLSISSEDTTTVPRRTPGARSTVAGGVPDKQTDYLVTLEAELLSARVASSRSSSSHNASADSGRRARRHRQGSPSSSPSSSSVASSSSFGSSSSPSRSSSSSSSSSQFSSSSSSSSSSKSSSSSSGARATAKKKREHNKKRLKKKSKGGASIYESDSVGIVRRGPRWNESGGGLLDADARGIVRVACSSHQLRTVSSYGVVDEIAERHGVAITVDRSTLAHLKVTGPTRLLARAATDLNNVLASLSSKETYVLSIQRPAVEAPLRAVSAVEAKYKVIIALSPDSQSSVGEGLGDGFVPQWLWTTKFGTLSPYPPPIDFLLTRLAEEVESLRKKVEESIIMANAQGAAGSLDGGAAVTTVKEPQNESPNESGEGPSEPHPQGAILSQVDDAMIESALAEMIAQQPNGEVSKMFGDLFDEVAEKFDDVVIVGSSGTTHPVSRSGSRSSVDTPSGEEGVSDEEVQAEEEARREHESGGGANNDYTGLTMTIRGRAPASLGELVEISVDADEEAAAEFETPKAPVTAETEFLVEVIGPLKVRMQLNANVVEVDLQTLKQTNIASGEETPIVKATILPAEWQVETEPGNWVALPAETTNLLEGSYREGVMVAQSQDGFAVYDLASLKEIKEAPSPPSTSTAPPPPVIIIEKNLRRLPRRLQDDSSTVSLAKVTVMGLDKASVSGAESELLHVLAEDLVTDELSAVMAADKFRSIKSLLPAEARALECHIRPVHSRKKATFTVISSSLRCDAARARLSRLLETHVNPKAEVPPEWIDQEDPVILRPLPEGSEDWLRIEALAKKTLPNINIVEINCPQNPRLWSLFRTRCELIAECNGGDANVKELFHGSGNADPKLIYGSDEGFDLRFCTSGFWGIASYFSTECSYSNSYSFYSKEVPGTRLMFLASVCCGRTIELPRDSSLRLPPPIPNGRPWERYDSVTGETPAKGGTRVYMVYSNGQAYPTYLITYTLN